MPSKPDYYEILGIRKNASLEGIRKAYRESALKYHPDRVPEKDKKEAEEKFKAISEAYAVLSDPEKRALYDQYGHPGLDQKYSYEDLFRGADFGSIFEDLADFGLGGDLFDRVFGDFDLFSGRKKARGKKRGADLEVSIPLTLEEAVRGGEKSISFPYHILCSHCSGSGLKPGSRKESCPQCKGQGRIFSSSGSLRMGRSCPRCLGQGTIILDPCPSCSGEGRIQSTRHLKVTIPPGVRTGTYLRLEGEGEEGDAGPGDLYVIVEIQPHSVFEREGDNLKMSLSIPLGTAILSGSVKVETVEGMVDMKIPPGTQSGTIFRLKGKGSPHLGKKGKGDQLVVIQVQIPLNLTEEQKKLVQKLDQSLS